VTDASVQSRGTLDRELRSLRKKISRLGDMVERTIAEALRALRAADEELANAVVDGDIELNELRFEIEEACLAVIATQQPAAGDLRQIVAAMNIVVDLERMGDHAAGIAKTVRRMKPAIYKDLPESLERMAALTQQMLRQALEVYAANDIDRAYNVARMDGQIDDSYQALFGDLLARMLDEEELATNALFLLFAGHNLERIGDRVTNIAERVIFMASGEMQELNPEPGETRIS
jgi:phosphate transport system protein